MDANAASSLTAAMGWDTDVYGTIERPQQSPVDGGGAVAQHGAGTASEDGRHPACLVAQSEMAHCIDTPMEAVEAAAVSSLGSRGLRQSRLDELRRRDDSMLHARDLRDLPIDRGAFVNHMLTKAPLVETLPRDGTAKRWFQQVMM